jgi:hypothetical protein
MYVRTYVCMYVFMFMCVYAYGYTSIKASVCNMYVCVYLCMYVCMHVCMYVLCTYVYMYVCAFFFYKNLFARSKYTHFSTGKYKNCSWSTNLPAEHSLCEEITVLSRQGMEGTAVKKWHKKKHCSRRVRCMCV